ncbi:MAG: class I SAM-dependent methyltransferase [Clostridiaceae bacterium]|nr:class I SAM-dependent methyltransferase [Clostridiaceae bacterium]
MTIIMLMIYNSSSVVYVLYKSQNYRNKGDYMSLSALKSCSERIENYLRYQPGYPRKLLNYLYEEVGFLRESVIADIGSGTGVLARLLLERGSRVVAIESDDRMRDIAERLLNDEFQRFVTLNATAENTTLFNESVNYIVCAHSLNGFCIDKCRDEFLRILKPSGVVVMIYNRLTQEEDFSKEYNYLQERYRIYPEKAECRELSEIEISEFYASTTYNQVSFPNRQSLDYEGARARLLSDRSLPEQGEDGYNDMINEFYKIFERYSQNRKIILNYITETYIGGFEKY